MDQAEIVDGLQEIFDDIFDETQPKVTLGLNANDVQEWDSLSNIQLIVEIENRFEIRFLSHEVEKMQTVADLIEAIKNKS